MESAGIAPVLMACVRHFGISLDNMAKPEAGTGTSRDRAGVWAEGAAYAGWTPSPHNIQPWLLRVRPGRSDEPPRSYRLDERSRVLDA